MWRGIRIEFVHGSAFLFGVLDDLLLLSVDLGDIGPGEVGHRAVE